MSSAPEFTDSLDFALGPVPDVQDPLVPLHRQWPDTPGGWVGRARELAAIARQSRPRVVFLGDSITQSWAAEGREEWDRRFAALPAVNLGIGGDRTGQILWRLADGVLDGLSPEVVVLLIGVNCLWTDVAVYGPPRVADGIAAVVAELERRVPDARILVLGILPTQTDPQNPLRLALEEINALSAARFSGGTGRAVFADIGARFLEPDGAISPEIMPDACHLSPRGYAIFADALAPLIDDLL